MNKTAVMDIKKYILIALIIPVLCCLSCKKDEDTTYNDLTGSPAFSLPPYGVAGDTFEFTAKGVTADDGSEVGYYWYVSPLETGRDTSYTYSLTLPDTLCTVTVYCVAFATGYYTSSTSQPITIVRADRERGSISGLKVAEDKDFFYTDARDGHEYLCTTIGSKDWFRENLSYRDSGIPLEDCEVVSDIFGRFYTWEEAAAACPAGWRLSSLADWADAASIVLGSQPDPKARYYSAAGAFMGDICFNGEKMWEYWPNVKITDQLGLSMYPMGYANRMADRNSFKDMYEYAAFWTADEDDAEQAYFRYFYDESPDLFIGSASKSSFAANVRCVRDRQ